MCAHTHTPYTINDKKTCQLLWDFLIHISIQLHKHWPTKGARIYKMKTH